MKILSHISHTNIRVINNKSMNFVDNNTLGFSNLRVKRRYFTFI